VTGGRNRTGGGGTVPPVRSGAIRVIAGCALLTALAACGTPDNPAASESGQPDQVTITPGPDGVQSVEVDAGDDLRFHPSVINARSGPVALTLKHVGKGAPHTWQAAQLPGASVPLTTAGQSSSVRFTIGRPGDYRFVCSIHEAQGQVGRLVVTAASGPGTS
jgi:plastocyanin